MDDKKLNHYFDRLAINIDKYIPYEVTEEEDKYGNTNMTKFVNRFEMAGIKYTLTEIDYPSEYVVTLECAHFSVNSSQHDKTMTLSPKITIVRGDQSHIYEAFTLMHLIHPEYLEDD